jgi:hypothetical protein
MYEWIFNIDFGGNVLINFNMKMFFGKIPVEAKYICVILNAGICFFSVFSRFSNPYQFQFSYSCGIFAERGGKIWPDKEKSIMCNLFVSDVVNSQKMLFIKTSLPRNCWGIWFGILLSY